MESTRLMKLVKAVNDTIDRCECDEIDGIHGKTYSIWLDDDDIDEMTDDEFEDFAFEAWQIIETLCHESGFEASKYSNECFEIRRFVPDTYYREPEALWW